MRLIYSHDVRAWLWRYGFSPWLTRDEKRILAEEYDNGKPPLRVTSC
jgi:hypothetical protein